MSQKTPFYITTAIAYPNGAPHIGHAYEYIATDAIARFKRLDGFDVRYLTGTDEHGLKMAQTAAAEGLPTAELARRNSDAFQAMQDKLGASFDRFIRTTDADHVDASIEIWKRMDAAGDIYLDSYSGCLAATLPDGKISCGALATVAGVLGGVAAATETGAEIAAAAVEDEIAGKRLETARVLSERACEVQEIDSAPRTANLVRSLDEITLEALRAQVQLELQIAQVQRSYSEAQRLQERQREATQQLIDVEAARNDPNVRIFRNESIINADIAFDDAMRAAYRATRMFEYYTSTSYARLDELFLIRLAARGRPNLENYLTDLENAFQDFEEDLGLPDNRVAVLSLLDDILQIPFADEAGDPIAQNERIRMMQDILADPGRLDANGYITIPFGTDFSQLSPLTRNHKIRYIEANVVATDVGDQLGRIYLRQRGTSIIRTIDDQTSYFVFPVRTAVVDAIFNGSRVFAADVYPNYRHRDRPYAHTMWELVINQRDEQVNRDINLRSLSDIQLFIHYTDFTVF